uniref:Uncharacterized protein n=1 Tax=Faxonius propinquus nudivirus TaxID=3139431 RepID=A0AAU8GC55_9VIRU
MGIYEFASIRNTYIKKTNITDIKEITKNCSANIYIDGSFYLFSGLVAENIDKYGKYNEIAVAHTALQTILRQIDYMHENNVTINKIYFYYDGLRPSIKKQTQLKRRQNKKTISIENVMYYLAEFLNKHSNIDIYNLLLGEAEHEIFLRRDFKRPTIIMTDDSDVMHIAYNYKMESLNDYVFICLKRYIFIYNMNDFNLQLPTLAFKILMMLLGSDFTNSVFTKSMVFTLLDIWNMKKNNINPIIIKFIDRINDISNSYIDKEQMCRKINRSKNSITANIVLSNNRYDVSNDIYFTRKFKYETYENITIPSIQPIYSMYDIYQIIRLFLLILFIQKQSRIYLSHISKHKQHRVSNTWNELQSIYWSVNYSTIGCFMSNYSDNSYELTLQLSNIDFFNDILFKKYNDLEESELSATYNFENTTPVMSSQEFRKKIERFMKNKSLI